MSDLLRTWRCHPEGLTEKVEVRVTLKMWRQIDRLAKSAGVTITQYARSALAEHLAIYDADNDA